jgi:hypothetical protein
MKRKIGFFEVLMTLTFTMVVSGTVFAQNAQQSTFPTLPDGYSYFISVDPTVSKMDTIQDSSYLKNYGISKINSFRWIKADKGNKNDGKIEQEIASIEVPIMQNDYKKGQGIMLEAIVFEKKTDGSKGYRGWFALTDMDAGNIHLAEWKSKDVPSLDSYYSYMKNAGSQALSAAVSGGLSAQAWADALAAGKTIPGAKTPDEANAMMDQYASVQDALNKAMGSNGKNPYSKEEGSRLSMTPAPTGVMERHTTMNLV